MTVTPMPVLTWPAGLSRRVLDTPRGPVTACYAPPRPDRDLGVAIVLVTGYVGSKEDFWPVLPALAEAGYHAWTYDQIGQYESVGPMEPSAYSIELLAEDARAVIAQVRAETPGTGRVHLLGHCLGGFIARLAVLADPSVVATLTLMGCGPNLGEADQRAGLAELDRKLEAGSLELLWPVIKRVIPERDAALRAFWFEKLRGANPGFMHGTARAMAVEPDRTDALAATGLPVLVLHGRGDRRVWKRAAFASMAARLGAEHVVIERAAHSPSIEQPEPTISALLAFWARHRPAPPVAVPTPRTSGPEVDSAAAVDDGAGARKAAAEARRLFLRMVRPTPEADPYPLYARLREIGPVVPIRFPGMTPRYVVTTAAECSAMLRDDALVPLTEEHFHETNPTWRDQALARRVLESMAFRSGMEHRLDRGMVGRHFAPARIEQRRAEITELADTLLDRLAARSASGQPVDIEAELSVPYSALVIGRFLGIPDERALRLGWMTRRAAATLELAPSPAQRQQAIEAGEEMIAELTALVEERRGQPADDMVGDLMAQCGPDEEQLLSFLVLLFSAGFDSPTSIVGLGLRLFLDNPEQARSLREEPELAIRAMEEVLRCEPAVQVVFRAAVEQTSLGGVRIPQGAVVLGLIGGALRDPALVADPDRFDIRREPVAGLAFGGGAHYCIGAYLARLSGSILFPRLLRRFPRMRAAEGATYRAPGVALRGFESLPVTLTPRSEFAERVQAALRSV